MGRISEITQSVLVGRALLDLRQSCDQTISEAIAIQQIPAPTFSEGPRAAYVAQRFRELGLQDVEIDGVNNVYGRIGGTDGGRPVIVSAHIDSVFSDNTDLTITDTRRLGSGRRQIFGPGIADNASGVAGLLALARIINRYDLPMSSDIWLVGNAAEEGLGDLLGMRILVERFGKARGYIVVEGGSYGVVYNKGIGVRRYRLSVTTEGGHSWGDFGQPSAIHVISRIISAIDLLDVPDDPKTSYNVGVIEGGTTINSIASKASCLIDLRSTGSNELDWLTSALFDIADRFGRQPEVEVKLEKIGQRPMGEISRSEPIVRWAADALKEVGCDNVAFVAGSTDANVPLSKGYPAVCIGLAKSGNTHRLDEFLDPTYFAEGLGQLLLLTLALSLNSSA